MEWLFDFFNVCAKIASLPDNWKKADTVPMNKGKGRKSGCKNYRSIILLNMPEKVFGRSEIKEICQVKMSNEQNAVWETEVVQIRCLLFSGTLRNG